MVVFPRAVVFPGFVDGGVVHILLCDKVTNDAKEVMVKVNSYTKK